MFPCVSMARDAIACSPAEGLFQSRDQIFHANSAASLRSIVAGTHDPPSICTSARAIGPPQAAPTIRYCPFSRVTLAGTDLSKARPTKVSVQTVLPLRVSSRIVT